MSTFNVGTVQGTLQLDASALPRTASDAIAQLRQFGAQAGQITQQAGQQMGDNLSQGVTSIQGGLTTAQTQLRAFAQNAQNAGAQAGAGLTNGISGASTAITNIANQMGGLPAQATAAGRAAGQNLSNGLQRSSAAGAGAISNAANNAAQASRQAASSAAAASSQAAAGQIRDYNDVLAAARQSAQGAQQAGEESAKGIGESFKESLGEIGESIAKVAEKIKNLWSAGGMAGKAKAAGALVGAGLGASIVGAMNVEPINRKMQVQLGLTTEEAKKQGKLAGELYASNYGESREDITDTLTAVTKALGGFGKASEDTLKTVTGRVSSIATQTGEEATRVIQVVSRLISQGLAKSPEEALDLIAKASQNTTSEMQGDLLDVASEYAVTFKQLGIDGSHAFKLISDQSQNGSINMDKVGDSLKEATIRLTDLSSATQAMNDLGLNYAQVSRNMQAGGDIAKKQFQQIVDGLAAIQDPAKRATDAIQVFGTPLEDLGISESPNFLNSLKSGSEGLGDFAGTAADVDKTLSDTAKGGVEGFMRSLSVTGTTIGNALLPAADSLLTMVGNLSGVFTTIGDVIGGVVDAFNWLPGPVQGAITAFGLMLALRGPITGMFTAVARGVGDLSVRMAATNGLSGMASSVGRLSSGIGRFAGFLGGPWGIAIGAAAGAIIPWITGNEDAEEAAKKHQEAVTDLTGTLNQVTGALTSASAAKISGKWVDDGTADEFKKIGLNAGEAATAIVQGGSAMDDYRKKIIAASGGFDGLLKGANLSKREVDQLNTAAGQVGGMDNLLKMALEGGPAFNQLSDAMNLASKYAGTGSVNLREITNKALGGNAAMQAFAQGVEVAGDATQITSDKFKAAASSAAGFLQGVKPDDFVDKMQKAAAAGSSVEDVLKNMGVTDQATVTKVLGALGDTANHTAGNMHYFSQEAADAKSGSIDLGSAAQSATGGVGALGTTAGETEKPVSTLASALGDASSSASNADTAISFFVTSLERLESGSVKAEDATRAQEAAIRGIGQSYRDSAQATQDRIDAEAALAELTKNGRQDGQTDAQFQAAVAKATRDVAAAKDKEKDATAGLADANEKAADGARQAVASTYEQTLAQKGVGAAISAAKAQMEAQRKAFIDSQPAADIASGAAAKYADKLGLIPEKVATTFKAETTEASANGESLYRTYDKTTGEYSAKFLNDADADAAAKAGTLLEKYNSVTGTFKAFFDADTQSALDAAQTLQGAYAAAAAAARTATEQGRDIVTKGVLQAKAGGGLITGAGNGLSDDITAKVSNGEFVMNARATKRFFPAISAMNAGMTPVGMPHFASGGLAGRATFIGQSAPSYTPQQGNVVGALQSVTDSLTGLRQAAGDATRDLNAANHDLLEAKGKTTVANRVQANQQKVFDKAYAAAQVASKKAADAQTALKAATTDAAKKTAEAAKKKADSENKSAQAARKAAEAALNKTKVDTKSAVAAQANAQKVADAAKKTRDSDITRINKTAAAQKSLNGLSAIQVALANKSDKLADSIAAKAQDLQNLQSSRTQLAGGISSTVAGFDGGILGHTDTRTSAADIIRGLQYNVQQTNAFKNNLGSLKSMGLNSALLNQIASSGVDQGGSVANILAHSKNTDIQTINALNAQLNSIGNAAGNTVAGAVYDAQINAANSALKSMQGSQAAIQKTMASFGTVLQTAFQRSLNGLSLQISPTGIAKLVQQGNALLKKR